MDFAEEHKRLSSVRQTNIEHNKNLLFSILKANNIKTVVVEFDGSGDSGSIENVNLFLDEENVNDKILDEIFIGARISQGVLYSVSGGTLQISEEPTTIEGVIKSICYDLMEIEHPGWENNDGAFGEFVFDLENDKINYTHNTRITDVETSEYSY